MVTQIDYSQICKLWDSEDSIAEGSKFRVGERVYYPDMANVFEVKGVNFMGIENETGEKVFEYALSGYPFLVYEEELETWKPK